MGYRHLAGMKRALVGQPVTSLERLVLHDMAAASADGITYAFGWDRLAEAIGKEPGSKAAERALERVIPSAIAKGFISRTRKGGNGRTAVYRLDVIAPDGEVAPRSEARVAPRSGPSSPPVSGELPPAQTGGHRDREEPREGRASAPTLHCPKHPDGNASTPCRGCQQAREARAAQPTISAPFTVQPGRWCPPGAHRLTGDDSCVICDKRPHEIAAEPIRSRYAGEPR